ncbi:unnamed protein product [Candidula unifasciata]|uniref:Uncharacterized protein n=1 Tax=Candidula unifasciata TaxID=100452 RepID=A0A8S3Z9X8_9EUPU|nr:unnamed protein product [Candidula unifasciata]
MALTPDDSVSIASAPDDAAIDTCSCIICKEAYEIIDADAKAAKKMWRSERNKQLRNYFKNGSWDHGEVTQEDYQSLYIELEMEEKELDKRGKLLNLRLRLSDARLNWDPMPRRPRGSA